MQTSTTEINKINSAVDKLLNVIADGFDKDLDSDFSADDIAIEANNMLKSLKDILINSLTQTSDELIISIKKLTKDLKV